VKPGAQIVLASAAGLYVPLIALFALTLVWTRAPGSGAGFLGGAAFALALVLHALVFGAAASRAAFPPTAARIVLVLAVIAVMAAGGLPEWRYAGQAIEAGVFAATATASALIVAALFGRAPTLRDAEW